MDTMINTTPVGVSSSPVANIQGSVDTMMRLTNVYATGCKKLSNIMTESYNEYVDQTTTVWQAMVGVRTFKEAFDVQTTYCRTSAEQSTAGAKKLVEASTQIMKEAMSPPVQRVAEIPSALKATGKSV